MNSKVLRFLGTVFLKVCFCIKVSSEVAHLCLLTTICIICIFFSEYNQQDATFLNLLRIYFCKTLFMFQTGFSSIIRSSKLHIQLQVFVRPIPLPAASLARLAAGSGIGLTLYVQFWAPVGGRKNCLKHVECLTEINKLRNMAYYWLYSENIEAMHGPLNVKYIFFFIKGGEESFLFSLYPEMRVCESTGYNSHFQYLNIQQQTLPNGLVSLL